MEVTDNPKIINRYAATCVAYKDVACRAYLREISIPYAAMRKIEKEYASKLNEKEYPGYGGEG